MVFIVGLWGQGATCCVLRERRGAPPWFLLLGWQGFLGKGDPKAMWRLWGRNLSKRRSFCSMWIGGGECSEPGEEGGVGLTIVDGWGGAANWMWCFEQPLVLPLDPEKNLPKTWGFKTLGRGGNIQGKAGAAGWWGKGYHSAWRPQAQTPLRPDKPQPLCFPPHSSS